MRIWDLPHDLLIKSVEHMQPYGKRGHEGLALWFGNEVDNIVAISHLVVPYGPGLRTHPLHLSLSMRAMERITNLTEELDCYWAGQIHSHPGTMVELSEVDERMGIHVQDYLSFVCPYYAQRETSEISEFGVHTYDGGAYRRVSATEVARRIVLSNRSVQLVPVEVLQ
jgi:hypothetical protein